MGSSEEEEGSYSYECPRHKVKISPFLIVRYPVTQAQWRAVALLEQVERDLKPEPSTHKGDSRRPVESVTWYQAVEFCRRLSRWSQEKGKGYQYRLPSEAEWEYACRAGTETPYHFGQKISPALANYQETARGRTTTVGRFQVANAFGLYDVHGNVWEWCEDDWHENYEGTPTDGRAWLSENNSQYKLLRGGSFTYLSVNCRSAIRSYKNPAHSYANVGLRVVASPRT